MKDGAVLSGAWGLTLAFIDNLCHLLFRCGCTFAWAGAAIRCNVHHPEPPHCPWCCHGSAGFLWVPALLIGAETAVILALRGRGTLAQIAGAAVTYGVVGAGSGLVSAWVDGYPTWLGLSLR